MIAPAEYLRAAKVDELTRKFKHEGYDVSVGASEGFDLVAVKNGKRVAIQVQAGDQLASSSERLARLRRLAGELGYNDFRLVVANPPRQVEVKIDGLEMELCRYMSENVPDELAILSSNTVVVDVGGLEIDGVHAGPDEIQVTGTGLVDVELQYDPTGELITTTTDFPFRFDVTLGPDLSIRDQSKIYVDTSSWEE